MNRSGPHENCRRQLKWCNFHRMNFAGKLMAMECPSTCTGTRMYGTSKTHRIMGSREVSQSRNWKVGRQSPVCAGKTFALFLLCVMLETGRWWGGVVGCEPIWCQHASGCVREKHHVCRHRGNRAYIHTSTTCFSVLVKTAASRHE